MHFSQIVLSIRGPAFSFSTPEQPPFPKDLFLRCKVSDGNLQRGVSRPDAPGVPGTGASSEGDRFSGGRSATAIAAYVPDIGEREARPAPWSPGPHKPGAQENTFSPDSGEANTNSNINIFAYAPPPAPPPGGAGAPPSASARGRGGGGGESCESRVGLAAL